MKKLLVLIVLSPAFFWAVWHTPAFVSEWSKFFGYTRGNLSSMFLPDKLRYVEEMRWNAFGDGKGNLPARLIYNKGLVLVDNFFSYLSFFSPRIFFQAGDGTGFSPPSVEPIAGFLFFFWVLGLVSLIRKKDFRFFVLFFILGIPAFLAGRKNLSYLLPVLILYIFIAYEGMKAFLNHRSRKAVLVVYAVYSLFLIGRILWLTSRGF